MIKTKDDIVVLPFKLYITTSLLNSWLYIFKSDDTEKAYEDFLNSLNKTPGPPNIYMERGIEFEQQCVDGIVPVISDLIKGGVFQAVATKDIEVDNIPVLMYGKLDVLKAGIIYDIKRVSKYETQKYFDSYQHHFYMELVPEAREFRYLINDGNETYVETYRRDETIPLTPVISSFFSWLRSKGLFALYIHKWQAKNR
jgi:hypothetical protein